MGYAVYHMEKGKGGSGGLGSHIDRRKNRQGYNTFGHASADQTAANQSYILNKHCKKSLHTAIADRIQEGYKGDTALRKDAVRFQTHILTGSHEEMKAVFSDSKSREDWINANRDWLIEKYGRDNIVRFTLHLDERTPHIHAVTVPITPDGRLSAKSFANGKKALRDLQSNYAEKMERFGLKRGLERTGIKHETAQEYYARQQRITVYMQHSELKPIEPHRSFLRSNINEIAEQNKKLSFYLATISEEKERIEKALLYARTSAGNAIEQNKKLTYEKDKIVAQEVDVCRNEFKTQVSEYKRDIKLNLEQKERSIEENQQEIKALKNQNERQENVLNDPQQLTTRLEQLKQDQQLREQQQREELKRQQEAQQQIRESRPNRDFGMGM